MSDFMENTAGLANEVEDGAPKGHDKHGSAFSLEDAEVEAEVRAAQAEEPADAAEPVASTAFGDGFFAAFDAGAEDEDADVTEAPDGAVDLDVVPVDDEGLVAVVPNEPEAVATTSFGDDSFAAFDGSAADEDEEAEAAPVAETPAAATWSAGDVVDSPYGRGVVYGTRDDGAVRVGLTSWSLAGNATVHMFVQPDALTAVEDEASAEAAPETTWNAGDVVDSPYGRGIVYGTREDGAVRVGLTAWSLAGNATVHMFVQPSILSLVTDAEAVPAAETAPISEADLEAAEDAEEPLIKDWCDVHDSALGGEEHFAEPHLGEPFNTDFDAGFGPWGDAEDEVADPTWCRGDAVSTQYGIGEVVRTRSDGVVHVKLTSWHLAEEAEVNLFLHPSALTRLPTPGDEVVTHFGKGTFLEARDDGSVVVKLESWQLAGDSRPMLYLKDLDEVSAVESLDSAAASPTEEDAATDGEASEAASTPKWVPGSPVKSPYGSGEVVEARPDGSVHVALKSWTLAESATVNLYLQPEAITAE